MSLREELAAKFANDFFPRVDDRLPYDRMFQFEKEAWRAIADECIRQMEYARRSGPQQDIESILADPDFPDIRGVRVKGWLPLETAPDDWTTATPAREYDEWRKKNAHLFREFKHDE
jgi:hypothetical protein